MWPFGRKKSRGLIGFYGLEPWWLATFSDAERKLIEAAYETEEPDEGEARGASLTAGDWDSSRSAGGALSDLAGCFNSAAEYSIAIRLLGKAEQMGGDALDQHFIHGTAIGLHYRRRDDDAEALSRAIRSCRAQIAIAEKTARAFKKDAAGRGLPSHKGLEQLAIILEKSGQLSEAIALCQQAGRQGWGGAWEKRIERMSKKLASANTRTPGPS